MDRGRRIFYRVIDGVILHDTGESQGAVNAHISLNNEDIAFIDLPFGKDADMFERALSYHIDHVNKQVIFDEVGPAKIDKDAYIADLENRLLVSEGLI